MRNEAEIDDPPEPHPAPAGLITTIEADPAVAIRPAGTAALREVELLKVVTNWLPFHCAVDCAQKLAPLIVSVKAGPPAMAVAGATEVIDGPGPATTKFNVEELPAVQPVADGLVTRTEAVAGFAIRAAVTAAVKVVEFVKVVASGVPFHSTTD